MDSKNSSTGQENEEGQQPSELPLLSEKEKSQKGSDHVPLVGETIRLQTLLLTIAALPFAAGSRNKTHPGDRAISTDLEGASRPRTRRSQVRLSSRLVELYRLLWESCVSKHIYVALKEAGTHLSKERDRLQLRHDKQLSRMRFFEQALESSRERLISVLDWKYSSRSKPADITTR